MTVLDISQGMMYCMKTWWGEAGFGALNTPRPPLGILPVNLSPPSLGTVGASGFGNVDQLEI